MTRVQMMTSVTGYSQGPSPGRVGLYLLGLVAVGLIVVLGP